MKPRAGPAHPASTLHATAHTRPPRHRLAWALIVAVVLLAHACMTETVLRAQGELAGDPADRPPEALDVAFVRELAPTLPPVAAAPPPKPRVRVPAPATTPEPAASAAPAAASQPELAPMPPTVAEAASAPELPLAAAEPVAEPASSAATEPAPAVAVAAAPGLAASGPVAFDWPPSTRLQYQLTGFFRGDLHGRAQVDWLRQGNLYQVRLEVKVDPIVRRRMLSDGVLSAEGLSPRRYDEETEVPFRETRRATVRFEPGQILLANGKSDVALPGVQDTASQFVQLTWLFLTHPERLQVGQTVDFPLALPRRVGRWTYDVAARETLKLPFASVDAYRLTPRPNSAKPNELTVEMWIAPSLQYLPVRIRIQQPPESHLDLLLDAPPVQAAR